MDYRDVILQDQENIKLKYIYKNYYKDIVIFLVKN